MQEKIQNKLNNERFAAFRYRDFRLLWIGLLVSTIGSQMQIVALNWHIYILTNSPIALGLIGLIRFVPIVIFSLVGGSFADVFNRKKIMLVTQSSLVILAIILAIVTFSGTVNPTIIYIITALSAIALSFDQPARQALIPNLVETKHLANALSLNVIMFQVSTIVGPMLAGFIIAKYNIGDIYAFNALSYLAVVASIIFMKTKGEVKGASAVLSLGSIKEGLVFVKSKTIIWSTMVLDFFSTFFSSVSALFPIFAKDILHVGPQGLGFMYAAPSIGAILAGFVMAHMGTLSKQGKILLVSIVFFAIGTIIFGLSKSFILSLLALFIVGAGDSVSTIIRHTIRQIVTPDYIRGRMTSINMIFFMGGPQLGEFQSGLMAAFIGAPLAVALGGVGTLVVVGIMAYAVPTLRRYDNHTTIL
ncbi:MAG: MFS transporter [Patescibacteria group bacterium]